MRKIVYGLAVLSLLVVVGLVVLALSLNSIVRSGIETFGPEVIGVSVKVHSVSLSPFSGQGRLKGLVVGNPEGFKTPSAFELDEVRFAVKPRSLLSSTIVIDEIYVRGPRFTYETNLKDSNFGVIMKNIEKFAGGPKQPKKTQAHPPAQASKKLRIAELSFLEGKAAVSSRVLGGKALEVSLPDLQLKDIGGKDGAMPAQCAAQIMKEVMTSVVRSSTRLSKENISKALGSARKQAEKFQGNLKGNLKGLKDLFKK